MSEYRSSPRERARIADLMCMVPDNVGNVLDVGARDGFLSTQIVERVQSVTALDLELPRIDHPLIRCVKGDATALEFADCTFDLVFCTEVLEHIPAALLTRACAELSRVSRRYVIIGVPYRQDIRVGRTTCQACGRNNPPWGHVNSFNEESLRALFPDHIIVRQSLVGQADKPTNALACLMMDLAGNPYGTYSQDEPCVHCGARLAPPQPRTLLRKVFTRLAVYARNWQAPFLKRRANWIHILFEKQPA